MSASATQSRSPAASIWLWFAVLAAGLAGLVLLFLPECRAALRVWSESTAYGHCYLVGPIAAYLAWDRRDTITGMMPQPQPALLLLGLPLPVFWFLSERLGIMEFRQLAALGFLELLLLVMLGWRLFKAMAGPLLYLVFLVPFGAFITPVLQSFTAGFIDVGLTMLGIPHYANDMLIEISAGTFFVAEACAGLRFLIASFAFGVFYALLNYRSPRRRAAFIAASIMVPIVANGLRALGIVVLGHILGSAEAAAADHVIYGWVFFSFVMLLLVVAGLPLREAPAPARVRSASVIEPPIRVAASWVAAAVLALAALGPAAARGVDGTAGLLTAAGLPPIAAPEGCTVSGGADVGAERTATVRCGERSWTVTARALSPRGTGAMLGEARGRILGPLDADEVAYEALHDVPDGAGEWQAIVSRQPAQISGIAVWVRGVPARGGIRQRVHQAIDSVMGSDRATVIASITTKMPGRLPEGEAKAMVAELGRIAAAQSGLDAAVGAMRVAAP